MNLTKRTTTSIFMTPTLGINLSTLNSHGYINSYGIDGLRFEQYQDAIYLLFKPTNWFKFTEFVEKEYLRTSNLIDDYDYENGHVVLVYKLNPLYCIFFTHSRNLLVSNLGVFLYVPVP